MTQEKLYQLLEIYGLDFDDLYRQKTQAEKNGRKLTLIQIPALYVFGVPVVPANGIIETRLCFEVDEGKKA